MRVFLKVVLRPMNAKGGRWPELTCRWAIKLTWIEREDVEDSGEVDRAQVGFTFSVLLFL